MHMHIRDLIPMKDAINFVDKQLLANSSKGGFFSELEGAHLIKTLGQIDLGVLNSLGLKQEDRETMLGTAWDTVSRMGHMQVHMHLHIYMLMCSLVPRKRHTREKTHAARPLPGVL